MIIGVFMGKCRFCGLESITVSNRISACVNCIRENKDALIEVKNIHSDIRFKLGLTPETPIGGSVKCSVCGRGCVLSSDQRGYCSIRVYRDGRLATITGDERIAIGLYYYDPHPTNCVAFPVCPAITGRGYPKYALERYGEHGYYNIAVFMGGCNLDCLYCQNWEYRSMSIKGKPTISIDDLVKAVNEKTTCVCFFGGDPGPWSTFVLQATHKMVKRAEELGLRVFRVCWETNGLWNPILFKKAVKYSIETGGIVKIDFKAWSPEVYYALTGAEPKHVGLIKKNIEYVASLFNIRKDPPLLVISTLLVPGYIDEYEIDHMTKYIADLNPEIPYVFLAFHPDYELIDLPRTSHRHMERAIEIARRNGLKNVYMGNAWLLGYDY